MCEIFVDSGEVGVLQGRGSLRAGALGSCIAVTAYDPCLRVGGLAHVMLPGAAPATEKAAKTKYAEEALGEMFKKLTAMGARLKTLYVCLVGGANVLGEGYESPGPEILGSINDVLSRKGIEPAALEVGGNQRRSCTLDVASGRVSYTVGDSEEKLLWQPQAAREATVASEKPLA